MAKFVPSLQQQAFFDWIKKGKGNCFIDAKAGTGKSTSLIEGAAYMKGDVAMVAFNTKIADELKVKISRKGLRNVVAKTFHSYGLSAWKNHLRRNFYPKNFVNGYKVANIIEETYDKDTCELYESFVKKIVSMAKQTGVGFYCDIDNVSVWFDIAEHFDLESDLDKEAKIETGINMAIEVLKKSIEISRDVVDFDDMIYMPVLKNIKLDRTYDWVLVDEAQDTNPIRRAFASMMMNKGARISFVGDENQAIYGFTGADADSVKIICKEFKCKVLPLTMTYRCPKSVVEAAQKYVPALEAHEHNKVGEVVTIERHEFEPLYDKLTAQDAILCRKTAPLVELAYILIRRGIPCKVEGRDIGRNLIEMMKKWKAIKSVETYLEKLEDWENRQIAKLTAKKKDMAIASIQDRADTIRALCVGCTLVDDVIAKITAMFGDTDDEEKYNKTPKLTLSTVHKSKGREWNDVYVLGRHEYMPLPMAKQDWEREQEDNLIYVAYTRTMNKLTLVG